MPRSISPSLKDTLSTMAREHLENNGDTDIQILDVVYEENESSPHAAVYWITFQCRDGTNILQITCFSNETTEIEEL